MGLGPLLARFRFLVLTTQGRKTRRARHTMLEHSVMNGRIYVAPGWGKRTQWYLNILAHPHVTVQRPGQTLSAIARRVTDDAELAELYRQTKGKSPVWSQYLESWGVEDTVEDFVAKKDRLNYLRLDPTDEPGPAPLKVDLVWVWPAGLIVVLLIWLLAG